jgi:two-component system, chemotaxis family, CheB/CheR fusion protein
VTKSKTRVKRRVPSRTRSAEDSRRPVRAARAARPARPARPRAEAPLRKAPSSRAQRDGGPESEVVESSESTTPHSTFPIVGIGASAGGLEAFSQLLRDLPGDTGMAFVVVQHLAPRYESMLTELLSNTTTMPVTEVTEGMQVEVNNVYVIPPNTTMGIMNGVLHLVPRTETRGQHMPIDMFLRSLADDQMSRAIGVILSGTASDGAQGLKAIKAAGGITIAQDPKTARYDGMPRAAIAAGVVDFILPVDAIGQELTKISRHPYVARAQSEEGGAESTDGEGSHLQRIFFLLRSATGTDFTHYKHATIRRRIRRRMVLHKVDRLQDYVRFLQHNPAEIDNLYQDILIHVTGFFRDPETFESLKTDVFPKILEERRKGTPVRVWVPGCSTGEEAYSFAIALLETLEGDTNVPIQIFATDISQAAVDKARAGFYSESAVADLSQDRLRRFFSKADGGYRISKTIRDMCVFAKQDVTRDPPFSKLDLISCRNLLIYLGPTLQKRVLSIFHYALKPVGYLVLGTSETIGSYADLFTLADKRHKFYVRKQTLARPNLEFQPEYAVEPTDHGHVATRAVRTDVQREIDRVILGKYAPAAVVISSDMQVLHVRGDTGKYLQPAPGEASMNILKMAREGLAFELRNAVHLARKRNTAIRKQNIRVRQNGHFGEVDLEVAPIELIKGERHWLIVFHDGVAAEKPTRQPAKKSSRRVRGPHAQAQRLEEELGATREYLQSIIQDQEAINEELQSANEEILSSNEELQSTNEELETAKEELQSTNEELNTVNEELQTRNGEMSQVNSDLTNLLASVQIPIIMVSNDLRIRRFTPLVQKIFNIIPTDLGRPIGDFKPNLKVANLEQLIEQAIDTVSVKEMEVQDHEGRWYSMRLRPYKNVDNKIDGAVITLVDIDAIKNTNARTVAADQIVSDLVDIVQRPLAVLDQHGVLRKASRAFYRTFRISPQEAEGRLVYDLNDGTWNLPRLHVLLDELLSRQNRVEDYDIVVDHPHVGRKTWILNAVGIGDHTADSRLVLLAFASNEETDGDRS